MSEAGRHLLVAGPVVAALVIWAAMDIAPQVGYRTSGTRIAKTQICMFADIIERFAADKGELPTDLGELIQRSSVSGRRYLEADRIPSDPWGSWYDYESHRGWFMISSWGEDQRMGTSDDICLAWSLEPEGDLERLDLGK